MKQTILTIQNTVQLAPSVFSTTLVGDVGKLTAGQFANIKIDGYTLRRPLSLCDFGEDFIRVVYKTVGNGTACMSQLPKGSQLDVLTGLGNGYDISAAKDNKILLVGGGLGTPPMYALAKQLKQSSIPFEVVLGFNTQSEIILHTDFLDLGANTTVTTVDGSFGTKGFVTAVNQKDKYVFACGPTPMLKAVYAECLDGQFSFEARMGCGFGACYGCTIKTTQGFLRVCADGPVFKKEQIIW